MQFEKRILPCLRRDLWQVQDREQTQEVRLPEGMPDIGTVLAAWGQCVMRSKEWLGESIGVSGGVMVWILYEPADGTGPRSMEAWVPVQGKWNLPKTEREGFIRSQWQLRGVDARTVSARKMMVRANVSLLAEVLEPWEAEVYTPGETEPDVQLLHRTYPARLPKEAGEKAFALEEEIPLNPPAEQILYCRVMPIVTEQKVIGGKGVFRGHGQMQMLYRGQDGQLHSYSKQIPFSQFSDLDRDYDKEAELTVMSGVSNLEPELREGNLCLKCGLVAQYLVQDLEMIETVEDAYSLSRNLRLQTQPLELPMVLDQRPLEMEMEIPLPSDAVRMVDSVSNAAHPKLRRAGDVAEMELGGTAQLLYYDDAGNLRGSSGQWSSSRELDCGQQAEIQVLMAETGPLRTEGNVLRGQVQTQVQTTNGDQIETVSALEPGAAVVADPDRPSLILRRAGKQSLWELAKGAGSTVDAIRRANGLTGEPVDERFLLIPVV